MASKGNTSLNKGIPTIKDAFVVIVKTEWNKHIVDKLESGAIAILKQQNISYKTIIVPGAVEIPFAIKAYAKSNQKKADVFIALGAVIRGDTPNFDYVCKSVLTVNDEQQATERIGGLHGNKGEDAAVTAIKMIALNRKLKS